MQNLVAITSIASISPLGNTTSDIWKSYLSPAHCFTKANFGLHNAFIAELSAESKSLAESIRNSDSRYKSLDKTVLYAMAASRVAIKQAGWNGDDVFGINIGSSRGATALFETYHKEFLQSGQVHAITSPATTLGNISSWVAHDLQSNGPEISHSITCSTALHAVLNAVAWLRSGMATKFLVGGSEAPLTDFTIAQMRAMKIYASTDQDYPCRALDLEKSQNTMILGEAASVCCLEIGEHSNALAYIEGIGYATELLTHSASISAEAECFQKSMEMALQQTSREDVDIIVMHAPGTIKGDLSEYKAIEKIFAAKMPRLTTNKWKTGHTFGASGMLNVEMAVLMLQHQEFIGVPYLPKQEVQNTIKKILVNAVGFGGNAVSILLRLP